MPDGEIHLANPSRIHRETYRGTLAVRLTLS